jgi:hypothetical protein
MATKTKHSAEQIHLNQTLSIIVLVKLDDQSSRTDRIPGQRSTE